jgi:16S rRNA (uracil1498-N3)-methyltransferase
MPRFYCPLPLQTDLALDLPASAARHVQVLRLQPGDHITLFSGGAEFEARIEQISRQSVRVTVGTQLSLSRESHREVHLALGMPANDRMDWLIEKATELGVASIQPLMTHRSVVKLDGERATKRVAHWEAIAISACEQCGRNQIPLIHNVLPLLDWLKQSRDATGLLLSLSLDSRPLGELLTTMPPQAVLFLSGPEGGLTDSEELSASAVGFQSVSLGSRILRADTAPLAALAAITLLT